MEESGVEDIRVLALDHSDLSPVSLPPFPAGPQQALSTLVASSYYLLFFTSFPGWSFTKKQPHCSLHLSAERSTHLMDDLGKRLKLLVQAFLSLLSGLPARPFSKLPQAHSTLQPREVNWGGWGR